MPEPDNPLWTLARRLAEWRHREGFERHEKTLNPWIGDTYWRDDGQLPSGDTFTLWMVCEL